MRVPRLLSSSQMESICLLLVYTLTISLFVPFAIKGVVAAPANKSITGSTKTNAPVPIGDSASTRPNPAGERASMINPDRNGGGLKVTPPARTPGAPGQGLPHLEELPRKQPSNQKAVDPISANRCSHKDTDCISRTKAFLESPLRLLTWGLDVTSAESPLINHTRAISDSPFRRFWSSPASLSALQPLPQSARTNVALAANGGQASASTILTYNGNPFPASRAIDGERRGLNYMTGGVWQSSSASLPQWVQVDFNGSKIIDEINVFSLQNNYSNPVEPTEDLTFSYYGLTGFEVQYWNGSSWVNVPGGNIAGNYKVWKKVTFSPVTTNKIRVLANATGDGHSRITELEAWGTAAPRTNVALAANGSVASASTSLTYNGNPFPASRAIDGERRGLNYMTGGVWQSSSASLPQWLQIDFPASKTIDEIDLYTLQDNYSNPVDPTEDLTFVYYGLTGVEVQYWNGSSWVTVPAGNIAGNYKVWKKLTFSAITTSKIRVLMNASPDSHSRIVEIEAWETTAGATRTNFALSANGGTASTSSLYSGSGYSFTPVAAINGDRVGIPTSSNMWHDAAPGNTFPDWLQVDFNGTKVIDEIDVFSLQDAYASAVEPTPNLTFSLYGLTGFEVQYWNGASWATVPGGSITGNNLVWRKVTFSPVITNKIRVLTNAAGDGWSRIVEVEAWGTEQPPRTNVALAVNGGQASSSSLYSDVGYSFTPGATINGDRIGIPTSSNMWHDAAPGNTFPDWLQVDFNGTKVIDEVDVFSLQDAYASAVEPTESMTFNLYGLIGFEVQYWNGSTWDNVPGGSITGNNKVWRKLTFSPVTTSKIRVLTNAAGDGWSRIIEVEAWGTAASSQNNQPPVVNAGGPYAGVAGTAIQFNSIGSNDPDGNITNYQWTFGDGTSDAGANPAHVYASAGTYMATLTVTDNNGAQGSASVYVTITTASNQPPVANLGGPYSAASETSIKFNGSNSADPDGTIVSYTWDFGDRTTGTGPNPSHAYISPQTYQVTLTVVDNQGAATTALIEVVVTEPFGSNNDYLLVGDGDDVGWGTDNAPSAGELENRRGNLPGHAEGNNNFRITAPVLSLPGRGLDVNLNLVYNSLLWNKSGNDIAYDIDHDWPAPGWQLGFGKMVYMGSGVMIVEADGSRHGFTGTLSYEGTSQLPVFKGNTTDGSFIEYRCEMRSQPNGVARYPGGTMVHYNNFARGFDANAPNNYLYPTMIIDSNGNIIQIKYDWDQREPRMQRIVDSLGRIIDFHYFTASDGTRLLSAITTKGLKDDTGAVTNRTLIRLHYKQIPINTAGAFSGLTPRVYKSSPWVIDAIYYPATGTGYWFGDADSYSSYGMIRKVVEQRGMGFSSTSLTEMGTVTAGTMTRLQDYSYPQSPSSLTKAPTFGTMTETWEGMDTGTAPVTTFEILDPAAPGDRVVTITRPDNTKIVQRSYNLTNLADTDPNKTKNGLVYQEEILAENNALLQKTHRIWEPGFNKTPRLKRIELTDDLGQMLATDYDNYGDYNAVGRVREYDYDGSVLRTTMTDYVSYADSSLNGQLLDPANVITPRLINLPSVVTLYTGDNSANQKAAITEYKYDEYAQPLRAYKANYNGTLDLYMFGEVRNTIIGIFSHSGKFNPMPYNNVDGGGSGPDKYITKRGNVTKIIKHADVADPAAASNVTITNTYDMTGNIIATSSTCCEQTSFSYELATQYAYPAAKTRGSADESSLARVTTSATYDFNTGLVLAATDANGRTAQNKYDVASLQLKKSISPTGARTEYDYDPGTLKVTQTTYTSLTGTTVAGKNVKHLNGLGLVRREESLATDGTDVVETKYDQLGRVWKQTRPYRDGETSHWNETVYDVLGRAISVRAPGFDAGNPSNPSNTATSIFYNSNAPAPAGASSAPGQRAKTVDAWGRWRWTRLNSSGQLAEVVEPNLEGGSGLATRYSYDTLGNLVKVEQGEQVRRFHYDALGRLTRQKLAETEATLNKAGERATNEQPEDRWSDVFAYDERSNMIARTDARGVRTNYNYNNDPLNRLQSVNYDMSRVNAATLEVLTAAEVRYDYRAKTSSSQLIDIMQVKKVTAVGVSTEEYDYSPTTGLLTSRKLLLPGLSKTLTIDHEYDTFDRVNQVTYPQQYQGVDESNPARKVLKLNYDIAGRLDGLKVNDVNYAVNAKFNAASQMTSVVTGNASKLLETYNYNQRTGLLTSQAVKRGSNTLMGFKYGYCQGAECDTLNETIDYAYTGQVTKIDSDGGYIMGNYTYTYDLLGRLKYALHNYGYYVPETFQLIVREDGTVTCVGTGISGEPYDFQEYSYDKYGNRTNVGVKGFSSDQSKPPPRDGSGRLSYDEKSNRITTAGYSYDAAGNQKEAGTGQVYIYDAAGRLAKVKQNGITVVSYTYGATRERLMTQYGAENSTQKTYYVWHGGSVIAEYSAASSIPQWTKNYIYFAGRLLATQQPDGTGGELVQYHHPDRLGTRIITNNKNTNVSMQETMPFGTSSDESSVGATNRRFTSYDRSSETGLDYAVNRYYDSRQGRFTQVDPLGIGAASLADPQSLNMYAYAGNDPVNRTDPDGLFSWGALFGGLFRAFFPQKINFSFTYKSLPPISVSFSNNFSNITLGFAGAEFQVKGSKATPMLGPCNLTTPDFDELVGHPALNLLSGPFDDDPRAFYNSLGTYNQAVLLNTAAAMADAGLDFSKARFVSFYLSDKPGSLPYGLIVSGFTTADLDKAGLGKSVTFYGPVPVPTGRRSPDRIKIGSLEVSHGNVFDVDLYNAKSNRQNHLDELKYNERTNHPTWPHDVARLLKARGVNSGVECE